MSHGRERKEKNCLNCGTIVQGRFCHVCGQENNEPKETFWHLAGHFFYDITHFDGKFFHSLKYLFTRPGFLPKEYMAGRRASYLNPVRMYIFTSAFFFLLFFSFFLKNDKTGMQATINDKTLEQIDNMDSASFAAFTANLNKEDSLPAVPMTREAFRKYADSAMRSSGIHFTGRKYRSKEEYDSLRAAGVVKHNWFKRQLIYKEIDINEKYKKSGDQLFISFRDTLWHSLPQMLFVSLPLLALLFRLIYIRRKSFYYMSHAIFCIYLYIFLFLALLILFSLSILHTQLHWGILNWAVGLLIAWLFFYEYKAMRNFYGQRRAKTIFKFLLINFLFLILLCFLFIIFILLSLYKI